MTTNTGIVQKGEVNLEFFMFAPGSTYNRRLLEIAIANGSDAVLIQTEGLLPFDLQRRQLVTSVQAYFDWKGVLRYHGRGIRTVSTQDTSHVSKVRHDIIPAQRITLDQLLLMGIYREIERETRPCVSKRVELEKMAFELPGTGEDTYELAHRESIDLDDLHLAREKGIPIFLLQEPWASLEYQTKIERISREGVVELQAKKDKYWGVCRGLQRIIANAKAETTTPETRYEQIKAEAARVFAGNDYHDKPAFLELMISPELKELADALPTNCGSIVVDCGHIDAPNFYPTNADELTLEEGAILVKYLKLQGHQDVKLNILVNEMYLAEQLGTSEARKAIRGLRKDAKATGKHFLIDRAYMNLLNGYGITNDELATQFEGILAYQCRQDLEAHQKGESRFLTPIVEEENGTFSVETFDDGTLFKRRLYSPLNAPMCSGISAKQNQVHEANGAGTIIYLRDIKHECGIRSGAMAGRNVYGLDKPIHVVFYAETKEQRVEAFSSQRL